MGGRGHKAKGDGYERELASYVNKKVPEGIRRADWRRAVLSGGGVSDGTYDLTGTEVVVSGVVWELGVEAKRTERLDVRGAMRQAEDHRDNMRTRGLNVDRLVPMVVSRRNREATGESLVVLRLEDLLRMLASCG